MSRQMLYRLPPVIISAHAWERWNERAGDRRPRKKAGLAGMLAHRLYGHMRTGGIEARGLAAELDLGGIRAVLRLGDGAWICTTVMDELETVTSNHP